MKKTQLLAAFAVALFPLAALATAVDGPQFANEGPSGAPMPEWAIVRLEKRTVPGFQPPHVPARSSHCRIYSDRVEIVERVGGEETERKLELVFNDEIGSVERMLELTREALKGEIVKSDGPMDAPTTTHQIPRYGRPAPKPVVLRQWGPQMIENQAPETEKLVKFVDLNCER